MAQSITVTVGRMGGDSSKVILKGQQNVRDALSAVGLNKKATEIVAINGEEVNQNGIMDQKLSEGDQIILTRNIEGGLK
mgnify:CR=1 FL=1